MRRQTMRIVFLVVVSTLLLAGCATDAEIALDTYLEEHIAPLQLEVVLESYDDRVGVMMETIEVNQELTDEELQSCIEILHEVTGEIGELRATVQSISVENQEVQSIHNNLVTGIVQLDEAYNLFQQGFEMEEVTLETLELYEQAESLLFTSQEALVAWAEQAEELGGYE